MRKLTRRKGTYTTGHDHQSGKITGVEQIIMQHATRTKILLQNSHSFYLIFSACAPGGFVSSEICETDGCLWQSAHHHLHKFLRGHLLSVRPCLVSELLCVAIFELGLLEHGLQFLCSEVLGEGLHLLYEVLLLDLSLLFLAQPFWPWTSFADIS